MKTADRRIITLLEDISANGGGGGGGGGAPDAHAASHADGGSDEVTLAQSQVTDLVSELAALNLAVTGKQPSDPDLTAIAALTPANDDVIQRKAGAWTNRTAAQVKTDLALATIATSGSASDLSAGTVPDARFPATLPVASGVNLTNLDASDLATGTVPDARFPATLPVASGVNLTNLDATDLASGTVPDARFPATLPVASGVNLTNLDASDLASGTIPDARFNSAGLPIAVLAQKASDAQAIPGIWLYADVSVTTTGAGTDLHTFNIPAGYTGWRTVGTGTGNAMSSLFVSSAPGTMAAGTLGLFDQAAGAGNQMQQTTAPGTVQGTGAGWLAAAAFIRSTAAIAVVRQMANSANNGTIKVGVFIVPVL